MKKFIGTVIFGYVLLIISCTAQRKQANTPSNSDTQVTYVKDSIEFYETTFEARQKNYRELLMGTWVIDSMYRQARMNPDYLSNVSITFSDSTFTGSGGCNRISGKYILKGTSIKFSDIISTKMACDRLEQETAFLQLLQSTVSAYTVTQNVLWLRDGSSNIVFHASKK